MKPTQAQKEALRLAEHPFVRITQQISEHKYVPRATMGDEPTQAQPETLTVDQWFARAQDNENDFRNLVVITRNHTPAEQRAINYIRELKQQLAQVTAQRDELLAAIMDLRKSWIAPHRFNLKSAESRLVDLSEKYDIKANKVIQKAEANQP